MLLFNSRGRQQVLNNSQSWETLRVQLPSVRALTPKGLVQEEPNMMETIVLGSRKELSRDKAQA